MIEINGKFNAMSLMKEQRNFLVLKVLLKYVKTWVGKSGFKI